MQLKLKPLVAAAVMAGLSPAIHAGNGNPRPGYPHDTVIIHVKKLNPEPVDCDGGHSLFLAHEDGVVLPAYVNITMTDWVRLDNDGDGVFDEDPVDEVDNDGDGLTDEDPREPGATTMALDCDASDDGEVTLQIRDTEPEAGIISTQEWFTRLIGKPEQNFAFTSYANQTVTCDVDPGPDLEYGTPDDVAECTSGDESDWVHLADYDLGAEGCVKQVKLGGKNGGKGGGKTPFCDITEGFEVDVDTTGDGEADLFDQFVFSISCADDPETLDWDESLYCPLSDLIWDVDENSTTSKAKAQVFVSHTGAVVVRSGKIKGR